MIDREKTVEKAIQRHHELFPVRGKKSLYDCFFNLRGEIFFIFRTKDKKIHKVRAEQSRDTSSSKIILPEIGTVLEALNRPIIIRSVLSRKPVKACLINLLPFPGISWTGNEQKSNGKVRRSVPHSVQHPRFIPDPLEADARMKKGMIKPFSVQQTSVPGGPTAYHYEIIATGYLPLRPFAEWMVTPDGTAGYAEHVERQVTDQQAYDQAPASSGQRYQPPVDTSTGQYEVIAKGHLPPPQVSGMPTSSDTNVRYVNVAPRIVSDRRTGTEASSPVPGISLAYPAGEQRIARNTDQRFNSMQKNVFRQEPYIPSNPGSDVQRRKQGDMRFIHW